MSAHNDMDLEIQLIHSILNFLAQKSRDGSLNEEQSESLTVACQCIESAFSIENGSSRPAVNENLLDIFRNYRTRIPKQPLDAEKAVQLKNEGNELMKKNRYQEAIDKYTEAIHYDQTNPVYFCNRGAAYLSLNRPQECVDDCQQALKIDPSYGKAHGRIGAAYLAMKNRAMAIRSLEKALQFDPNNENAIENLKRAKSLPETPPESSNSTDQGFDAGINLQNLLQNPQLMNLATQMMSNPSVQEMIGGVLSNLSGGENSSGQQGRGSDTRSGLEELLRAGQQMAATISSTNPDLIETIRRNVTGRSGQQQDNQDRSDNRNA